MFDEAYEKAYLPFINILERHPEVKMVLHYSGSLLDYLFENRPEFIEKVKMLAGRGQVEVMTGGYYEPILPLIPAQDSIGQINLLTNVVRRSFNYSPKGAWLAERVWEPHLPKVLSSANVEYTVLDDSHFRSVGIEPEKKMGY
ncbi:MAG: 4-alpha-glucanotransferase, partial [Candidatus Omnitrophica bacterium]|nr:4-alpha-glucanotransferase [Candidatus Omnitrophota bacterium]